jgi:hypothetical protein
LKRAGFLYFDLTGFIKRERKFSRHFCSQLSERMDGQKGYR